MGSNNFKNQTAALNLANMYLNDSSFIVYKCRQHSWRRDAQAEQITVFCDFSRETSEMMIKCCFISERYNVTLFL